MQEWVEAFYQRRSESQRFDFHTHQEFEIYLFHAGECDFLIGERCFRLQPGDILLMNGLTLHRPKPRPVKPYVRSVVQFCPDWIRSLAGALDLPHLLHPFERWKNSRLRLQERSALAEIDATLARIAGCAGGRWHGERRRWEEARLKTLLVQLLITLNGADRASVDVQAKSGSPREQHAQRTAEWIDHHYAEKITLDTLAEALNLSKYYLAHTFKAVTGTTVMAYLTNRRLMRARCLLETAPEMTISEVARRSGFESGAHFSRRFHGKIGVSPSRYRQLRGDSRDQRIQAT